MNLGRVGDLAITGTALDLPCEPVRGHLRTRATAPALPVLAPAQGRGHGQPPLSPARLLLPEVGQEEVGNVER